MPRVLIVDDDPDYRHMVRQMLQARGLDAEATESAFGLSARLLNEPRIDLVLLDCRMPGLTGSAVLGVLAKNPRLASIPLLLMSAATNADGEAAAAQHPRCRFVHKPSRLRDLVGIVEATLAELP
jgi:CheY-like chemotaxis protein